jgi:hypothetical protein
MVQIIIHRQFRRTKFQEEDRRESPLLGERVWVREVVAEIVGADVRRL